MCFIVLVAAIYIMKKSLTKLSILGASTALYSLVWLAPIANATVFYKVDVTFLIAHAILAMGVGIGAFTFLKD